MFNLFSNAVKFTPDGGRVWVTAKKIKDPEQEEFFAQKNLDSSKMEDFPMALEIRGQGYRYRDCTRGPEQNIR